MLVSVRDDHELSVHVISRLHEELALASGDLTSLMLAWYTILARVPALGLMASRLILVLDDLRVCASQ